jgi:hypothetical protein
MAKIISPKQVVYLVGAGATHAEVVYQGGHRVNLLMKDSNEYGEGVCSRILEKVDIHKKLNIQRESEIDIEKLISLLGSSSNARYRNIAEDLRASYYKVILDGLAKTGVLNKPELAIGLLEMHKNQVFNNNVEILSGLIVLNHDNLFQTASQKIYSSVKLGFKFNSNTYRYIPEDGQDKNPLIVKLYGSFDWRNGVPIRVKGLNPSCQYSKDMLWIPPSILKESRDYPYNKLMGLAYELLSKRCDILRVIGCSLNQNDWNVISLLFNSQYNQLLSKKSCYKIELIIDQPDGENVKKECSYLQNITPIAYLPDGYFGNYKENKRKKLPKTSGLDNPFMYWLKTKTNYHLKKGEFNIKDCKILKKIAEA